MCAITGIINLNKKPVDKKVLWDMTNSLAHRGPDGKGIYVDDFVGKLTRRTASLDL